MEPTTGTSVGTRWLCPVAQRDRQPSLGMDSGLWIEIEVQLRYGQARERAELPGKSIVGNGVDHRGHPGAQIESILDLTRERGTRRRCRERGSGQGIVVNLGGRLDCPPRPVEHRCTVADEETVRGQGDHQRHAGGRSRIVTAGEGRFEAGVRLGVMPEKLLDFRTTDGQLHVRCVARWCEREALLERVVSVVEVTDGALRGGERGQQHEAILTGHRCRQESERHREPARCARGGLFRTVLAGALQHVDCHQITVDGAVLDVVGHEHRLRAALCERRDETSMDRQARARQRSVVHPVSHQRMAKEESTRCRRRADELVSSQLVDALECLALGEARSGDREIEIERIPHDRRRLRERPRGEGQGLELRGDRAGHRGRYGVVE